jgi:hypothetical protein
MNATLGRLPAVPEPILEGMRQCGTFEPNDQCDHVGQGESTAASCLW